LSRPFAGLGFSSLSYRWSAGEAPGRYRLFLAALRAGALSDGTLHAEDILHLVTTDVLFVP
jgi:hypothetical protein